MSARHQRSCRCIPELDAGETTSEVSIIDKHDLTYQGRQGQPENESHIILNKSKYSSPYILSITFKKVKGETALHTLEKNNIIVGTGSACNSHSKAQEPTLLYILEDESLAVNTIRISLSTHTTYEELDELIKNIKEIGNK